MTPGIESAKSAHHALNIVMRTEYSGKGESNASMRASLIHLPLSPSASGLFSECLAPRCPTNVSRMTTPKIKSCCVGELRNLN
jgi:hypothetical protein